jgi:formylglycine-generating enzyme
LKEKIMKLKNLRVAFFAAVIVALVVLASGIVAQADTVTHGSTTINMDFVNVGNAGNTADDTGYGTVGYNYRIGTYEVTADQWAAVIAADSNVGNAGLWSGSQPTAGTSWYEAAKFCNWLTTGDVNSGVYNTSTWAIMDHQTAGMTYGTAYFIPTEDEWYKAAYYDPDKASGAGYWDYPTGSDSVPTAVYGGTATGTAVFYGRNDVYPSAPANVDNSGGLSPYGTMGQGGNVWEWNEADIFGDGSSRGLRGGSWFDSSNSLLASYRNYIGTTYSAGGGMGFRVASVPEPCGLTLLICGAIAGLMWRKRRK